MFAETKILVTGIVQGVGFRPFCARLAKELSLSGSVRNTSHGVEILLLGEKDVINHYLARLQKENPDASAISSVQIIYERESGIPPSRNFIISHSEKHERQRVLIPPDIATCDDCLKELLDPSDRRHGYPFINCTNCGPRYTIIRDLPYDRPKTTMAPFSMCHDCSDEYQCITDRRYHAQPNACHVCGPSLWLTDNTGRKVAGRDQDPLGRFIQEITAGNIGAVKGLGGFHLTCDAFNDIPVSNLRERKKRPKKPLAIMVRDIRTARRLAHFNFEAERTLLSSKRPIVLCYKRENTGLSENIAPGQDTLGMMLPYTPLHHLLMQDFEALVMTSANISDSPIIADNDEAIAKLSGLADYFLMHDREIHMPIDDSVIASIGNSHIIFRRSRGFVPVPLSLPFEAPVILASGGEMKSTFSITQERDLFPSQYLGDLKQVSTVTYYKKALHHFLQLYNLEPEYVVHDTHPQYISTGLALDAVKPSPGKIMTVQHHHAHLAACLLENRHWDNAVGVIFDGTGYGDDGTIWGGEFLFGDIRSSQRKGTFLAATLPGGERSVLEPWRYALSILYHAYGEEKAIKLAEKLWPERKNLIEKLIMIIPQAPVTTSAGRFFDAMSALTGVRETVTYDGQAAIELEAISRGSGIMPFGYFLNRGLLILDWRPALDWTIQSIGKREVPHIGAAFHMGLSKVITEICMEIALENKVEHIALSGGVWQNKRLLALTRSMLRQAGLKPLIHQTLSPNDECVSVGQAAVGATRWAHRI